jgi:ankyrin repeat protein
MNEEMNEAERNEALRTAAESGDLEGVRKLIGLGADVNAELMFDSTPLYFAATNGHIEVVRYLVESCGVDVDSADMHGGTALMRSVEHGSMPSVICLLELGAGIDAADYNGFTSPMRAVEGGKGRRRPQPH